MSALLPHSHRPFSQRNEKRGSKHVVYSERNTKYVYKLPFHSIPRRIKYISNNHVLIYVPQVVERRNLCYRNVSNTTFYVQFGVEVASVRSRCHRPCLLVTHTNTKRIYLKGCGLRRWEHITHIFISQPR